MAATAHEVVGRDDELAALARFLDGEGLPAALVLRGDPGIGKTTIWRQGVADAARRGYAVLSCTGSSAETRLAYSALSDLLAGVLEEFLPLLPEPQRRALAAALLLEETDGTSPDRQAIGAATLRLIRQAAEGRPVLVAIDDAQWLDPSSASTLDFAARRLGDERVALLVTVRPDTASPLREAERVLPLERLEIGPLSLGATHALLRERLATSFPRPLLTRIWQTSAGNPFFALELAQTLSRRERPLDLGQELPVPRDLETLMRERLEAIPEPARRALEVVALEPEPTVLLVERVLGEEATLAPSLEARILDLDGERVRFTHPLLAAAVRSSVHGRRRLELHRRLAELVDDREARSRHLAAATDEADEGVAAEIEGAAQQATARGAPAAAADLLEHAARLTPEDDVEARVRRTTAAGLAHLAAGNRRHGAELLEQLAEELAPGPARAEALRALARVTDDRHRFLTLVDQASQEAEDDPAARIGALLERTYARMNQMDFEGPREDADEALALAEGLGDDVLLVRSLAAAGKASALTRRPEGGALLERAVALEEQIGGIDDLYDGPRTWLGWFRLWQNDLVAARPLLEGMYRRAREAGNPASRAAICWPLCDLEWRSGRWDEAAGYAEESVELGEQLDSAHVLSYALCLRAMVSASRGDPSTPEVARHAIEIGEGIHGKLFPLRARAFLGHYELSHTRFAEAVKSFEELPDELPLVFPFSEVDRIEALVGAGRIEEAAAALARREQLELDFGSVPTSELARAQALLSAARGDFDSGLRRLEEADRGVVPLETGRTLLALGSARRRARQKRTAREALSEAREIFDGLGARVWRDRADVELGRLGGRTASRGELTATERRIADLVAAGRKNKEVAAELFVTVHTVEAALTRIYGKLGVRSRTELASRLVDGRKV